ncbi:cysteine-rich CWC family protein [Paenibacillus sp. LHD-117]|uniref:cysteine-rich CWC family protein n=1 Tax=Paenibacillus sp. LHD-117 TaxID=3071412 RepID=UPI0027E07266|nr:cysteine-rich CWC family protein [Paenibacillus sp. LHD-117]MDQ6420351.1 cysteine-rich CWC family protein [Paenibacillus sp. LHD-117]
MTDRCPICGSDNGCALKEPGTKANECWCFHAKFPQELLALVPEEARNKSCICRHCTEGFSSAEESSSPADPRS